MMNQYVGVLLLCLGLSACGAANQPAANSPQTNTATQTASTQSHQPAVMDAGAIIEAFGAHRNLPQVSGTGIVTKVLKDDTKGLQHQKFLLKISPEITILIAHNIDLAPRVAGIKEGDTVEFKGEYIYTPKGGTVHWTHQDPRGHRVGGWLKHQGNTYQ